MAISELQSALFSLVTFREPASALIRFNGRICGFTDLNRLILRDRNSRCTFRERLTIVHHYLILLDFETLTIEDRLAMSLVIFVNPLLSLFVLEGSHRQVLLKDGNLRHDLILKQCILLQLLFPSDIIFFLLLNHFHNHILCVLFDYFNSLIREARLHDLLQVDAFPQFLLLIVL